MFNKYKYNIIKKEFHKELFLYILGSILIINGDKRKLLIHKTIIRT